MIQNPALQSGGRKYKVDDSELIEINPEFAFLPKEAEPGSFVTTYSGMVPGSAIRVESKDGKYLFSEATWVKSINELPPKVQQIVQQAPQTYAPPITTSGYDFFIMPHEDVRLIAY